MPKVRKFKVDEWVWYAPLHDSKSDALSKYRSRAVILSICDVTNFFDYRIYIEETAKFKTVREKDLLGIE